MDTEELPPGGEAGGEDAAPEPLPDAPINAIIEALLFASDEPVTIEEMAAILGGDRRPEIEATLQSITRTYDDRERGLRVQRIAGGYRLTTDPAVGPFVREMVRCRNRKRLSRAALETLAIIAYKQPITAPEIQQIRGVNPSAILGTLLDRRMIRILGRKKVVGKPFLYGTTREFLIRFGLNSLEDLPDMGEVDTLIRNMPSEQEPATPPPPAAEPSPAHSGAGTAAGGAPSTPVGEPPEEP